MRKRTVLFLFLAALCLHGPVASQEKVTDGVVLDKEKRTVTIDAKIAPRKLPTLDQIYPIEVIACWPTPKGQKAHETVVIFDEKIKPSVVHKALVDLGLKPGAPVKGPGDPKGPTVKIYLILDGEKKIPIEKSLIDPVTGKQMPPLQWRFTGSAMTKPPGKDEAIYGADLTGTLIAVFPVTDETVFQTNLTIEKEKFIKMETNKTLLPKEGSPVKLVIEAGKAP
jgi:hypothetical protein